MTVNDLIKQLQAMSEEDRERVVVINNYDDNGDDYQVVIDICEGWYRKVSDGFANELGEFEALPLVEDGTGKKVDMDGLYQKALAMRRMSW